MVLLQAYTVYLSTFAYIFLSEQVIRCKFARPHCKCLRVHRHQHQTDFFYRLLLNKDADVLIQAKKAFMLINPFYADKPILLFHREIFIYKNKFVWAASGLESDSMSHRHGTPISPNSFSLNLKELMWSTYK